MKKITIVLTAVLFIAALVAPVALCATDAVSTDKAAIKAQHDTMKANAQAAKSEEKDMKKEIKEVAQSGDKEKAKSMREELRKTHKENVGQRREDVKNLHEMRKEAKQNRLRAAG